jgi:hypothetical protein
MDEEDQYFNETDSDEESLSGSFDKGRNLKKLKANLGSTVAKNPSKFNMNRPSKLEQKINSSKGLVDYEDEDEEDEIGPKPLISLLSKPMALTPQERGEMVEDSESLSLTPPFDVTDKAMEDVADSPPHLHLPPMKRRRDDEEEEDFLSSKTLAKKRSLSNVPAPMGVDGANGSTRQDDKGKAKEEKKSGSVGLGLGKLKIRLGSGLMGLKNAPSGTNIGSSSGSGSSRDETKITPINGVENSTSQDHPKTQDNMVSKEKG